LWEIFLWVPVPVTIWRKEDFLHPGSSWQFEEAEETGVIPSPDGGKEPLRAFKSMG
jgi:hypothetical protein